MRKNPPLKALKSFEAAARHLSFTRAAKELFVTPAAVSQQIRILEERLGITLFRRQSRSLELTEEAALLYDGLHEAFRTIENIYHQFEGGEYKEVLTLGCVGTFALGWLEARLGRFQTLHPHVDVRLRINNNIVNIAAEGLDLAIRFGTGIWPSTNNEKIFDAPFGVLCDPEMAGRLRAPRDLLNERLLRSYRMNEWEDWFREAGEDVAGISGTVYDSSGLMIQTVIHTGGAALVPLNMFTRELTSGQVVQPFETVVNAGSYWLTYSKSRIIRPVVRTFRAWLLNEAHSD
ncbi:LysR family transcriptional regulator [Klebsiella pneumoniae]|uniref:LysR family transcriptional regulator n=1 Tax=Klebsiella pneumoniae TaxID=573 RepID=UPI003852F7ED